MSVLLASASLFQSCWDSYFWWSGRFILISLIPLSVLLFRKVWTRPSVGKGQFLRSGKQTPCRHRFPWAALAFLLRPCPSKASQAARQNAILRLMGPSRISTLSVGTGVASWLIHLSGWIGTMWCKLKNVLLDFSNNNVVDNKNEQFCRIRDLF